MPVLIYERVKTAQYMKVIKRHRNRLIFAGKLNVVGLLLVGLSGYWYLMGTKYGSSIIDGLMALMATAKLDDGMYRITEWFHTKGRFIVYVTREH